MTQSAYRFTNGLQEGEVLAGRFRVEKILGVGGMGVILAAHHIHLDEKVAIKFPRPEVLRNPDSVKRFMREARAASKIKSEHVARVIDVAILDNGAPFMVMEYLEGGDLGAWLQQKGPLSISLAIELFLQACEAIAEAHVLGIVHRDLKPSNLFCVRRPDGQLSIKVLDFGLTKFTSPQVKTNDASVTGITTMLGSPRYMSPEQLKSPRDVDTRTDIWALGIILFEMLTGEVPFPGATLPELSINIATEPTPPVRSLRPDVPAALERVICRCLEKAREQRYANVAELAAALKPFGPTRARASVDRIRSIIQRADVPERTLPRSPIADTANPVKDSHAAVTFERVSSRDGDWKRWLMLSALGVVAAFGIAELVGKEPQAISAPAEGASGIPTAASAPRGSSIEGAPPIGGTIVATTRSTIDPPPNAKPLQVPPAIVVHKPTSHQSGQPDPTEKPRCDKDFELDADGNKHFNRQCFPTR